MSYKLLIDGKLVSGSSTTDVVNPATGEVFATCARSDQGQLDLAVAAAKEAFPAWSALGCEERRFHLERLIDAIEARSADFIALLTREMGKPMAQAQGEIMASLAALRYFASVDLRPEILRETDDEQIIAEFKPLGVVAAITPWNFPFILLAVKLGPALITGNTLVVKPAATMPLTTVLLGEIAADILPPGVLNIIVDDNDLGEYLTTHEDVAKISFTGSTGTGKRVMTSAAGTLKRITLELDGNDVAIMRRDASVKDVAPRVFQAAMMNAGQLCLAAKSSMRHARCMMSYARNWADWRAKPWSAMAPIPPLRSGQSRTSSNSIGSWRSSTMGAPRGRSSQAASRLIARAILSRPR